MTIKVCKNKFNKNTKFIKSGIYQVLQFLTMMSIIVGIYLWITQGLDNVVLFLLFAPFGIIINADGIIEKEHWLITINNKFHIISGIKNVRVVKFNTNK